jgi:cytochrome c553
MKVHTTLTLSLMAVLGATISHAAEISAENHQAALRVAVTTCATCHGPQGHSISPKFPNLAGQRPEYFAAQMNNFRSHTRGDPDALGYMWGMAAPLDDDMIVALAAYYSSQQPARGVAADRETIARGQNIYRNGVASAGIPACIACHGANATGAASFPALAGQSAQYLTKQLRSFQSNLRDVAIMHGVASELKANEMTDVAVYLNSL